MTANEILDLIINIATAAVPAVTAITAVIAIVRSGIKNLRTDGVSIKEDTAILKNEVKAFRKEVSTLKAAAKMVTDAEFLEKTSVTASVANMEIMIADLLKKIEASKEEVLVSSDIQKVEQDDKIDKTNNYVREIESDVLETAAKQKVLEDKVENQDKEVTEKLQKLSEKIDKISKRFGVGG